MAVTKQSPAPYTAGSALLMVVRRFRDKGLTTPFTADVLVRAGVSDSLVPRTLQSMQALELMDDKGMPTDTLQKIRVAPEKEYKTCLGDWLKSVYAEVFSFVDPAKDDAGAIRDAFRAYTPIGQQERMVALFLALCAEAGLVDESKKSESKPRKPSGPRPAAPASRSAIPKTPNAPGGFAASGLPPALAGLVQSLPLQGWTKEQRDHFVQTFESVLDYVIPIVENTVIENEEDAS